MDRTGQQLGSYQILQSRSRVWWIGTHRLLHRPVEFILLERTHGQHRQAVIDAVAALDRVQPPNTARVHDLIPDPDDEDALWIVQEALEEQTLQDALRSGPISADAARALCRAILPAINALHEQQLAHGDITPGRIRLTQHGPILTGFTEARIEMPSEQHLAPELWSRRNPSPTSDIYAFGVCLYEALTCTPPFPRGLPRAQYARLHQEKGVPDLAQRRPDLPHELIRLVQDATQIQRRARAQSARELQYTGFRPSPPALTPTPAPASSSARQSSLMERAPAPVTLPASEPREEPAPSDEVASSEGVSLPLFLGAAGAGLLLFVLCGAGLIQVGGPAGMAGIFHDGPQLRVDNPLSEAVTVACSSGPERVRVGAILDPSETKVLLLSGAPADCIAFTSDKTVKMRWQEGVLPADGEPWQATVGRGGEESDTGEAEGVDDILLELLPSAAADTGEPLTVVQVPTPTPAPAPAPVRQPARRPEAEVEVVPVALQVTVKERRRRLARGVDVYVDGVLVGEVPVTVEVVPGEHVVRWVKSSRLDHRCVLQVSEAGASIQIDPGKPACPGEEAVESVGGADTG